MTDHQHSHSHSHGTPSKSGGFIPGLLKGMATTARTLGRPTHTAEYPDVKPHLPPRTKGVIALLEENCTSCMLCSRECPDWCIYIDSHKETLPATAPGGRERQRNVLDRFAIDFSLCMYCGICIEVCPFDALHWSPEFEYAEFDILDLIHEKDRLGQWMATVPPPEGLDPRSAEPSEITAANKPPRVVKPAAAKPSAAAPAVEKPAVAPAAEKPAVLAEPAAEKPAEPSAGKPAEPAAEKPAAEKPAEPSAGKAAEPAAEKPAAEKPAELAGEKPADTSPTESS